MQNHKRSQIFDLPVFEILSRAGVLSANKAHTDMMKTNNETSIKRFNFNAYAPTMRYSQNHDCGYRNVGPNDLITIKDRINSEVFRLQSV